MIKYFFWGILITALLASTTVYAMPGTIEKSMAQAGDSITLDYLVGMDKKKFRGKTLAEFLESSEAKGYQSLQFKHTPEGVLEGVRVKYSSNLYLNIYVREFRHLQPKDAKRNWDMELLKKERIDEIRVVYVMHEGN